MNPKPYYQDLRKVKAIILGADPSTGGKIQFEYVFGIDSKDNRYFASIERNLAVIGLARKDIYVQNMIQDYLIDETSKNKDWEKIAESWVPTLLKELDAFDPNRKIPVLVTAERIFNFLMDSKIYSAKEIYKGDIPLSNFETNKLNRQLIPFYRHFYYSLKKEEWANYSQTISHKVCRLKK